MIILHCDYIWVAIDATHVQVCKLPVNLLYIAPHLPQVRKVTHLTLSGVGGLTPALLSASSPISLGFTSARLINAATIVYIPHCFVRRHTGHLRDTILS